MTSTLEVDREQSYNPFQVPTNELARIGNVWGSFDNFFGDTLTPQDSLDKQIVRVQIDRKYAEIVKYQEGEDGSEVRSLEIPLDDHPLEQGSHEALAFSLKVMPDGTFETEKH